MYIYIHINYSVMNRCIMYTYDSEVVRTGTMLSCNRTLNLTTILTIVLTVRWSLLQGRLVHVVRREHGRAARLHHAQEVLLLLCHYHNNNNDNDNDMNNSNTT